MRLKLTKFWFVPIFLLESCYCSCFPSYFLCVLIQLCCFFFCRIFKFTWKILQNHGMFFLALSFFVKWNSKRVCQYWPKMCVILATCDVIQLRASKQASKKKRQKTIKSLNHRLKIWIQICQAENVPQLLYTLISFYRDFG